MRQGGPFYQRGPIKPGGGKVGSFWPGAVEGGQQQSSVTLLIGQGRGWNARMQGL